MSKSVSLADRILREASEQAPQSNRQGKEQMIRVKLALVEHLIISDSLTPPTRPIHQECAEAAACRQ